MNITLILALCIGIPLGLLLGYFISRYLTLLLFVKLNKVRQEEYKISDYSSGPVKINKSTIDFHNEMTDLTRRSILDSHEKELDYFVRYCSNKKE